MGREWYYGFVLVGIKVGKSLWVCPSGDKGRGITMGMS